MRMCVCVCGVYCGVCGMCIMCVWCVDVSQLLTEKHFIESPNTFPHPTPWPVHLKHHTPVMQILFNSVIDLSSMFQSIYLYFIVISLCSVFSVNPVTSCTFSLTVLVPRP